MSKPKLKATTKGEAINTTLDLKRWVQPGRRNSATWKVIVLSVEAIVKQRPWDLKGPQTFLVHGPQDPQRLSAGSIAG